MIKHFFATLIVTLLHSYLISPIFIHAATHVRQTKAEIKSDLLKLYPYFDEKVIERKIDLSKDSFEFLRAFVPYFYFLSIQTETTPNVGTLNSLRTEYGWCVGDAHLENFGAVLDRNGKSVFTVNDMDDSGPCPLYLDMLRFLTGYLLHGGTKADLARLVDDYRSQLTNIKLNITSPDVLKLLRKSQSDGPVISKKSLASESTLVRNSYSEEISSEIRSILLNTIRSTLDQKAVLIDAYQTRKQGGGSHGMIRYETLVNLPNFGGMQHIEFKELVNPGIFPVASPPIPPAYDRIKKSIVIELGESTSPIYQVVKIENLEMLIRPKWKGNKGISFDDYPPDHLFEIAREEIRTLANIHMKSAGPNYSKYVQKSNTSDWQKASQMMADKIGDSYFTLK